MVVTYIFKILRQFHITIVEAYKQYIFLISLTVTTFAFQEISLNIAPKLIHVPGATCINRSQPKEKFAN